MSMIFGKRIFRHHPPDEVPQDVGNALGPARVHHHVGLEQRRRGAREGRHAAAHLVEHGTQGVDVHGGHRRQAVGCLGRHVQRGARAATGRARRDRRVADPGHAEIGHARRRRRGGIVHEDIGRFDITVHEASRVNGAQPRRDGNSKTKLLAIQRSPGYSSRRCISISELKTVINKIKSKFPDIIIMIDNCYCEFVEKKEPLEVGADIVVGSLLKNLGAGITLNGGYIVSNSNDIIESISNRLTSPGLGKHVGVSFGTTRAIIQGLYFAPHIVLEAVKSAILVSYIFEKLGYKTIPKYNEKRSDVIQVITLNDENKVIDFCRAIQEFTTVGQFVI